MPVGFTKLRIAGFKSFAEPAVVEIRPGLTGIVGPNGCGKSNVVEALRWAMGENSARSLRGGEMDDVIFAGTTHRPARNLAEVVLTLESNAAGRSFPAPFHEQSEMDVSRRIERGSGSFYRMNGKEARARDVQTLFADMASGARSSAMVSQGRVGSLVNARPDERRAILEEAAGIGGLHARRHEAELKLRAAEANLERAEDLRTQLTNQLAALTTQAKQAARYRNLSGLVRAAEAELLGLQRARTQQARDAAHVRLAELQRAIIEATTQAQARTAQAHDAAEAVPALRETEARCRTELERRRVAREQVEAEQSRARAALAAAREALQRLNRDRAHAEQLHRDASAAEQRLGAEASQLADELSAQPAIIQAAGAAVMHAEAALRVSDAQMHEATTQSAALAARSHAAAEALRGAELRFHKLDSAVQALTREQAGLRPIDSQQLAQAEAAHAAADNDLRITIAALETAETSRATCQAAHHASRTRSHDLETAQARLAAEHQALSEILGVHAPGAAVRLVDALHVPDGLEAAIGAALDDALELTEDTAAPRHFRPLDPLPPPPAWPARVVPLAEQVEVPPVLRRALSLVGLVDGDAADLQAALAPGQTLVGRDGAVWRWDGFVQRSGAPTAAAVRLQQRNRMADLRVRLNAAERNAATARQETQKHETAARDAVAAEAAARQARRTAEPLVERRRQDLVELQRRAETVASRIAALQTQAERLAGEHAAAAADHETAQAAQDTLPDLAQTRAQVDVARAALAGARAKEQQARSHHEAAQRQASGRQGRQRAIIAERSSWSDRARDATSRLAELDQRRQEAAASEAALASLPDQLDAQRADAHAALQTAGDQHQAATQALQQAERAAGETDTAARAAQATLVAAREATLRTEADVREADHAWGTVAERILERLGAHPELPTPADLSAEAEERARRKQERLSRERAEMGPVNLRAEIEAAEIETRLGAIDADRAELGSAIAKLRGSIGHLNREGRERLNTVFAEVDTHFQHLFSRMFGGGRAQLALVGSDDPLQAGLEIYAQPPGKKLATLSLLSGGEQALTALSLIFAVFRCNPAPVCVLDEVDAPLDDANIDRFCALLDDMVRETGTRFLVVTHHHLTMARMDRLYGVTMQERGVSRVLSVDLAAAAEMVEPVAMAAE